MITRSEILTAMQSAGYSAGRESDQEQRRRDFRGIVQGQNFMTPSLAAVYRLKAKPYVLVEISFGEFLNESVIGFTVIDRAKRERLDEDSGALFSLNELAEKFAALERKFS